MSILSVCALEGFQIALGGGWPLTCSDVTKMRNQVLKRAQTLLLAGRWEWKRSSSVRSCVILELWHHWVRRGERKKKRPRTHKGFKGLLRNQRVFPINVRFSFSFFFFLFSGGEELSNKPLTVCLSSQGLNLFNYVLVSANKPQHDSLRYKATLKSFSSRCYRHGCQCL